MVFEFSKCSSDEMSSLPFPWRLGENILEKKHLLESCLLNCFAVHVFSYWFTV
jgi:hypothetical protein